MATFTFQKPDKVIMIDSTDFEGKFEFRPLEPGYGLTVGNALRRVLLSSLEGFAFTSIKLENVDHEFTSLPGIVEDITEIILNLKQIRLKRYLANDKDEFAPHVDSMNVESAKRFLVFFIYLDDNERGETNFPQLGLASPCKQGSLLMFPPLWPWVHAGMKPVKKPKYMVGSYLHYI